MDETEHAGEEWLPVPDFEGLYEFSNHHRVRSIERQTPHGRGGTERTVQTKFLTVTSNNGYLVARIQRPYGRPKKFYVEAAVQNFFNGIPPADDTSQSGEEWKPIPNYENLYEISSFGRVKSLSRYVVGKAQTRFARAYIRLNGADGNGYPKVELSKDGVIRTVSIHRLVADAFVPNPLGLDCVHHRDENKSNCRAENLEWITRGGNVQDWFDRRRIVIGIDTIETIIAAHAAGKSPAEILAGLPRRIKKRHGA